MSSGASFFRFWLLAASLSAEAGAAEVVSVEVLKDETRSLTLDQVIPRSDWTVVSEPTSINLGLSSAAFWLRVRLDEGPAPDRHLVVGNPGLDDLQLHRSLPGGSSDVQSRGYLVGNENRFGSRHLAFDLLPGERGPYYLRVTSRSPLYVPLALQDASELYRSARHDAAVFGALFAVIWAFALYNMLIYLSVKRAAYLYYAAYGISIAVLFMSTEGYLPTFVASPVRPLMVHISGSLAFASLIMFTRKLIGTRRLLPRFDKVMRGIAVCTLAIPIGAVIADSWVWSAAGSLVSVLGMLASLGAVLACLRKRRAAWVFAASFTPPILGTILYSAQIHGALPTNSFTLHSLHIGVCIEVILFSQALALVINRLHRLVTKKSRILARANRSLSREVAERKRIAEEVERQRAIIIHTAKMRELGMITAAIAHDIASPLTIIRLWGERIEELADENLSSADRRRDARKISDTLAKAVTRISGIVQNTLSLARVRPDTGPSIVSVTHAVEDIIGFCRSMLSANSISIEAADLAPLQVRCRPVDLSQILLNLVNNAADALKKQQERRIRIFCRVEPGVALIGVEDNGPGVDPENVPKLMLESFTTKGPGEGTGIGLSVSRLLAERNGGKIIYQRNGGMTVFVVQVPLAEAEAEAEAEPIAAIA